MGIGMWSEKRGKSVCLDGQFGSHVIKTINIVDEALVRGMSSRFVMGWEQDPCRIFYTDTRCIRIIHALKS